MRVVIFGGTTEGRSLACTLAGMGARVDVSVATEDGREEQPLQPGIQVHTGRLEAAEMAALLAGNDLCVDATHPYSTAASANVRQAAQTAAVPYHRLLRRPSQLPANSVLVPSAAAAAEYLAGREGNVLLAIGTKELSAFAPLERARLYPRILPAQASLAACEANRIPHRNIIAMQGPFSQRLNEALLEQFAIRYLVTKDGGDVGGFAEKAAASAALGVSLVVIRRPEESGETMEEILRLCEEMMTCR